MGLDETGEPILSRRIRNGPPALADFVGTVSTPATGGRVGRVKRRGDEADMGAMDAIGAKLLAARIRAGVSAGMRIELVDDATDDSGLRAGDRGLVRDVDESGRIVVQWDRGFESQIDPETVRFQKLAA